LEEQLRLASDALLNRKPASPAAAARQLAREAIALIDADDLQAGDVQAELRDTLVEVRNALQIQEEDLPEATPATERLRQALRTAEAAALREPESAEKRGDLRELLEHVDRLMGGCEQVVVFWKH
jgi:hypothetical protein